MVTCLSEIDCLDRQRIADKTKDNLISEEKVTCLQRAKIKSKFSRLQNISLFEIICYLKNR